MARGAVVLVATLLAIHLAIADGQRSGLDVAGLDRSARPQDDLFLYANGAWLTAVGIPADRVTYGTFAQLSDTTDADLRAIIDDVIAGRARVPAATRQQISDLYLSATDETQIERLGAAPLQPELHRIDAAMSASAVPAEAGYLSSIGAGGPFDGSVGRDPLHPDMAIVRLLPGGTLLPDLRYYVDVDPAMVAARAGYESYLRVMFELTGRDEPAEAARDVLALETALARAQWDAAAVDEDARFTLRELASAMPGFDWTAWARPQGLDRTPAIILSHPAFFKTFAALVPQVPVRTWQNWLVARYVTAAAPFLSSAFDMARFTFFGSRLTGQAEPRARWKRGVTLVNAYLGDALGRLYVERHFPPATLANARTLVDNLMNAARDALRESPSMTPGARREALTTLATMSPAIGAPGAWHDYAGLVVRRDDLFGNWLRALAFENSARVRAAGAAAGGLWSQPPQTVNAYYAPATNEIVIPAAILQPPIFDPAVDAAVNYGAAGALVGHEIVHAFGAAERLGDAAGLALAYRAYQRSLKGQRSEVIDGLTGEQRLFLGWARMWREKDRAEYRRSMQTNAHDRGAERANAAAAAVDGFYDAFGVKPGDRLFVPPSARVRTW